MCTTASVGRYVRKWTCHPLRPIHICPLRVLRRRRHRRHQPTSHHHSPLRIRLPNPSRNRRTPWRTCCACEPQSEEWPRKRTRDSRGAEETMPDRNLVTCLLVCAAMSIAMVAGTTQTRHVGDHARERCGRCRRSDSAKQDCHDYARHDRERRPRRRFFRRRAGCGRSGQIPDPRTVGHARARPGECESAGSRCISRTA